jgi:hypothetical protein
MKSTFLRQAALAAAVTVAPVASRDALGETFTYAGAIAAGQAWESGSNWTSDDTPADTGDSYPGQVDPANNATLSIDLGGSPLGVDIASAVTVSSLTLGDTNAAPSATTIGGAGTLTATTIVSGGAVGATNNLDVDVVLTGTTTNASGGTNPLNLNGTLSLNAVATRTLKNDHTSLPLNVNGPVELNGGNLLIRNNSNTSAVHMYGAISNGSTTNGRIELNRGIVHFHTDNTYSGNTSFGSNTSSSNLFAIIYSDDVFSTGQINVTGGGNPKTLEAAAGFGTRTLDNEVRLSRSLSFAGTESIVLSGKVFQSSTRSLINDIAPSKSLSLTGTVFTDQSGADNGRTLTFEGTGVTNVSAVIDDEDGDLAATKGVVRKVGVGRLVYQTPGMAQYNRGTEVYDGVLQLGVGAAPVNLNGHAVAGSGAATTGTLAIDHDGSLDFDSSLTWNVNVDHVGQGTTTFSDNSFGTGAINVSSGKLLINGGVFAGSSQSANRTAPGGDQSILDVTDTSVLHVGQPITGSPVDATATTTLPAGLYVTAILSPTQIAVSSNVGNTNGGNVFQANLWNFNFGAGTGTGSASVNAVGGTVGGNGVIGGSLSSAANGVIAPGNSIGTLSVLGDATIGGVFDVEYDGAGAGLIDLLAVTGNLTLDSLSTLDLAAIGSPADDSAYVFASYGGSLSGTFGSVLNMPSGYTLDYAYGGSSIALVAIPEPSTLVLAGVLIGACLSARRES